MTKIIKNAIQCKLCGEVIESKHVHDFVQCKCGACAVDADTIICVDALEIRTVT